MSNDDVIAQLRAVDPAAPMDLSCVDPGALRALREGITMTAPETTTKRARRMGRRGLFVAGISVVLVGGGVAYAAHQQFLGGDIHGWNCQVAPDEAPVSAVDLTGDPIADCATFVAQAGLPPVADPVAFTFQDATWVAPADLVPEGAVVVTPSVTAGPVRELEASLRDRVDGGAAHCPDQVTLVALASSELARLSLTDWTVAEDPRVWDLPCSAASVDAATKTVTVAAFAVEDVESDPGPATPIRDALRTGITDTCVNISDARSVADRALGEEFHWPTTAVVDESVPCARVDLEVGGSAQVTVYGPTVAHP